MKGNSELKNHLLFKTWFMLVKLNTLKRNLKHQIKNIF